MPEAPGDPRDNKIVVEYRPSARLFRRATHAAWRSQTPFKVLFLLLAALLLAVSYAIGAGAGLSDQLPVAVLLLTGFLLFHAYPLLAYSKKPEYRSPVRFEFSRNGFTYRRGPAHETLDWSAIQTITETKSFYVLTLPKRFQLAIPKTCFQDGQEQHFRILAATEGVPIN